MSQFDYPDDTQIVRDLIEHAALERAHKLRRRDFIRRLMIGVLAIGGGAIAATARNGWWVFTAIVCTVTGGFLFARWFQARPPR